MADRYWLGANTDWSSSSNWSTTRGGSGGSAAPTSSDDVYIYDGNVDITTNITNVAAQSIKIGGKFSGNIGGGGTPLTVGTATCPITIETVATNKKIVIGAYNSITISATMNIRSTGGGSVEIANGASGVITTVQVGQDARVLVTASGVVTNIESAGGLVFAEYNATAFTSAEICGGGTPTSPHIFQRAITTLNASASAILRTENAVAITTANLRVATLTHNSSGTITTANAFTGGILKQGDTPFTITNSKKHQGGVLPIVGGSVTFTNTTNVVGKAI